MYVHVSIRSRLTVRRVQEPAELARCLDAAIAEAWERAFPAWSAPPPQHGVRSRVAVRAVTPELRSLALALREAGGTDPETLRLCRGLRTDGFGSPLYGGDAEALRREAGRLRVRLLASAAA
jgi:hypothetical protein